ncbi:hypothetical protein QR680_011046 [Steinernema hermaphroditum]|uniref:Uncharacterized protein n=1 Tax=Steinernema hermaphroditum TaxID=289476 RepID=A0AA39MCJ7_9BILA|nr:hypothetical protein QR680_011046 [Steinernema hermaphroditum]
MERLVMTNLGNCVKDRLFRFWDTVAFVDGDQVKLAARGFRFSQFGEQIFVIRGVFSLDATTWIYASVNDRRAKHFHHYELVVCFRENNAKEEKICFFAKDGVVENLILFPRDVPAS